MSHKSGETFISDFSLAMKIITTEIVHDDDKLAFMMLKSLPTLDVADATRMLIIIKSIYKHQTQ